MTVSDSPSMAIVDNTTVTTGLTVSGTTDVINDFSISVNISHSWIGDLQVTLRSPAGTEVILHNRTGRSDQDIVTTYNGSTLSAFAGESFSGTWTLLINDNASQDQGTLNSWSMSNAE